MPHLRGAEPVYEDSANVLTTRSLSVVYGAVTAVDGVSLEIPRGQLVGLIGPNGAGKTTLVDAVTGLVGCNGTIILGGKQINEYPPHKRAAAGIARTFQSIELFDELTVRENLLVTAERARWWSPIADLAWPRRHAAAAAAVDEALELFDLTRTADARPPELSLGHRKLVGVARAMAARPQLLLLDEPAAGLDSDESRALGEKLKVVINAGVTILLVDHDMGLVLGVCDLVHVLDFGKLIASAAPSVIRTDQRVIDAYLGSAGAQHGGAPELAT